jgi:hypothetical protein
MEKKDLWKDPIVEEVREARQAHAEKFGNDLNLIAQDLKRHEEEDRAVVSFPPKHHRASKGAA